MREKLQDKAIPIIIFLSKGAKVKDVFEKNHICSSGHTNLIFSLTGPTDPNFS